MKLLDRRLALLLTTTFALWGCPGDDSGDDGASSGDTATPATDGTTSDAPATTDAPGTTTDEPGTTTDAPGTTTDAPGDSSGEPGDSSGEATTGTVDVTVAYEGMQTGTLSIVLFTEFPPMGPPVAAATDMDPAFPYMGSMMDIPPGEYVVFGVLDVGNDNPTMPGPEDPTGMTAMPIMVEAGMTASTEITLMDPA